MSMLDRFKEIMLADMNALLDEAEDPSKMLDQYLRNMADDLESVKSEIATVIAEEKRIQKIVEQHNGEIRSLTDYATKALQAGNEDDSRVFLGKKALMIAELSSLEQQYDNAIINTQNIKKMYDKLTRDFLEIERNIPMLKAKLAQAKLQGSMSNMLDSSVCEDKAAAMIELDKVAYSEVDNLKNKYDSCDINSSVENELSALKQKLNDTKEQITDI